MFWGRINVYAKRGKNGGYYPQCNHRWNDQICPKQRGEKIACENCGHTEWTALTPKKIMEHLLGFKEDGSDVIGIYPLLPEGTCRFLVFDFDNHEKGAEKTDFANADEAWHEEVDALRLICESNDIVPLVERSRSGRGLCADQFQPCAKRSDSWRCQRLRKGGKNSSYSDKIQGAGKVLF